MMKNTSRLAKKGENHPLCSRKRSLMKIVDSPSYQKRRALEKENAQAKRKSQTEAPKFDYLKRKSRYGDDFLVKKPESRKSFVKKTETSKLDKSVEIERKDAEDGPGTPLRVPLCAVERKNQHVASRRRTISHIASRPKQSSLCRATKRLPPSNLAKPVTRPLPLPTRSPCLKKTEGEIGGKTKHYPPTRSPFTKKKKRNSVVVVVPKTLPLPTRSPLVKRRHTMMPSKANERHTPSVSFSFDSPSYTSTTRKPKLGTPRRCSTLPKWTPGHDDEEEEEGDEAVCAMTPWKNSKMSMRERLDLWLASKNKCLTPHQSKSFVKSPHPNRRSKSVRATSSTPRHLVKLSEGEAGDEFVEPGDEHLEREEEDAYNSSVIVGELGGGISKELEELLEKADDKSLRGEVEQALNDMVEKYTTVVKFADYWICKARLAAQDDDVQRVVCMLEQAHAFQAQPGERIKEEICRYLELLEAKELENDGTEVVDEDLLDEQRAKLISLYAITPGRRVHFAAQQSPLDFKSSVIRFCLLESKAFKRRLREQLKRKVLTPVRRSIRVRRSEGLPEYLRSDSRVVESPGEVEDEIVDGQVSFVPNNTINTPLNNGWLLQDERETQENEDEQEDQQVNEDQLSDHLKVAVDERSNNREVDDGRKHAQEDDDDASEDREIDAGRKHNQEDDDETSEDREVDDGRKHDHEDGDEASEDREVDDGRKHNQEDDDEVSEDREVDDGRKHNQEDDGEVSNDCEDNGDKKHDQEDGNELTIDQEVANELKDEELPNDAAQEELVVRDDVKENGDVQEANREEKKVDELRGTQPADEVQEERDEEEFDESALELSFM